jgi:hypothetical protein
MQSCYINGRIYFHFTIPAYLKALSKQYLNRSMIEERTTVFRQKEQEHGGDSFSRFVFSTQARYEVLATLMLCILTFLLLRYVYPFPNFYSDTGAYINAASSGDIGLYRPIGFSWLLAMAHAISQGPAVLVFIQTFLYYFSSLALFLSAWYFFRQVSNLAWHLFFPIFILAPTCVYLSNFVISDSLFISLTNLWVATLVWILGKGSRMSMILNLVVLALLLQTRYIALFYPLISVICIFIAHFKRSKGKFFLFSFLQVLVFLGVYFYTKSETKQNMGVAVFSGFSGWQKANNAMHVLPFIKIDPGTIKDAEVRKVHQFIMTNMNPAYLPKKDTIVVAHLWSNEGPLRKYMASLQATGKRPYIYYWHLASVALGKWADYILMHYPGQYVKHFMKPNAELLFALHTEVLFYWYEPTKEIKTWFGCKGCAIWPRYHYFHNFMNRFAAQGFNILWVTFASALVGLLFRSRLQFTAIQYQTLLVLSFFCILYIVMSVYASPIVLRYMLVIRHCLVMVPFLVFINLFSKKNQKII